MRLSEMIYTEEEMQELRNENKKLKECNKSQSEVINNVFIPQREELEEENRKLKLHIEAKDKAYVSLLKDYEEIKEDNKRLKAEIGERLDAIRKFL